MASCEGVEVIGRLCRYRNTSVEFWALKATGLRPVHRVENLFSINAIQGRFSYVFVSSSYMIHRNHQIAWRAECLQPLLHLEYQAARSACSVSRCVPKSLAKLNYGRMLGAGEVVGLASRY